MHTMDACTRGTLSVTPAVLMCGTEASLSPAQTRYVQPLSKPTVDRPAPPRCLAPPQLPQPPNEYWCLRSLHCSMKGLSLFLCPSESFTSHNKNLKDICTNSSTNTGGGGAAIYEYLICSDLFLELFGQLVWAVDESG